MSLKPGPKRIAESTGQPDQRQRDNKKTPGNTDKLGITKYSIVTNSTDSVTLRLMTEHDLAMLYEWLNRSHIVEWWGG
ncbi:hypothetical protein MJP44_23635, partial [Escherichia coli]|nr:hypothetical protein [Escherichia coli]MCG8305636.1 hypothetical protein [Escherichia coli]